MSANVFYCDVCKAAFGTSHAHMAHVQANPDTSTPAKGEVINRARSFNGGVWPEQLDSGVMFFEGQRITKAEFNEVTPSESDEVAGDEKAAKAGAYSHDDT